MWQGGRKGRKRHCCATCYSKALPCHVLPRLRRVWGGSRELRNEHSQTSVPSCVSTCHLKRALAHDNSQSRSLDESCGTVYDPRLFMSISQSITSQKYFKTIWNGRLVERLLSSTPRPKHRIFGSCFSDSICRAYCYRTAAEEPSVLVRLACSRHGHGAARDVLQVLEGTDRSRLDRRLMEAQLLSSAKRGRNIRSGPAS